MVSQNKSLDEEKDERFNDVAIFGIEEGISSAWHFRKKCLGRAKAAQRLAQRNMQQDKTTTNGTEDSTMFWLLDKESTESKLNSKQI